MDTPTHIGKYEILSILGRGGMGVVYRAQDPRIGRQVAIKTVTEGLTNDAGMLQRFYREAEKMGMLKHPNIITVYDLGEQDGYPYIVMEYVEGDPLDHLIKSERHLPLTFKLRIVEQVCSALGYAHSHDVVHRDVKPANVIVRPDGLAKLLDFGIARQEKSAIDLSMTATGGVIGTVPYMAPERLRGLPLDGRSDIFAAGVMLYQVLTGSLPFTGEEIVLVNKLLNDRHRPLSDHIDDYPPALDTIIDRALEKNPVDRYQTSEEMATDLFGVIETLKEQYSTHVIAQVEQLVASQNFVAARDALVQLLRVDNQHTQARRLLADVNQHLTLQQRSEQGQQKRRMAEDALGERRYDDAIHMLEDAAKLLPDDRGLADQLAEARKSKATSDQILEYLRRAEAAKNVGNFEAAQMIVEKALKLDTNNSRLRSAYLSLVRQAEEAAQKTKVKSLADAARKQMEERKFSAALLLIKEAEETAPADAELLNLRDAAQEGLAQEERRKFLEEIDGLIAAAVTRTDLERVMGVLHNALESAPTDPTLLRYQSQLDGDIRTRLRNEMVDAAVKDSLALLDTRPLQALELVRKTLLQAPGDDRLLALESSIRDRLARQTEQETRNGILLQAREALTQRQFADAVAVLEQCKGSLWTQEVAELLEFARMQAEREQQQALVAACYAEALSLQREGKDEALIQCVQPVLGQVEDANLRKMLVEAKQRIDDLRAEEEAALTAVQELLEDGCYEQAILFIEGLPERMSAHVEIQGTLAASKQIWEQEWTQMERLGQCYAALETPNPLGSAAQRLVWEADLSGASKALAGVSGAFAARRSAAIDRALEDAMKAMQTPPAEGAAPAAAITIDPQLLQFASDPMRGRWLALQQPGAGSGKFMSRFKRK